MVAGGRRGSPGPPAAIAARAIGETETVAEQELGGHSLTPCGPYVASGFPMGQPCFRKKRKKIVTLDD